jgi:pimeloyl-ACP methyl ester carboxylesterase
MNMALFVATALFFRVLGGVGRQSPTRLFYVLGWLCCALAWWLLAGAAGALSPGWLVLALGVGGALIGSRHRPWVVSGSADALMVVLPGVLTVLSVNIILLLGIALFAVAFGTATDAASRQLPKVQRQKVAGTLVATALLGLSAGALAYGRPSQARLLLGQLRNGSLLKAGVLPVHEGERIVLPTSAVAWLDRPSSRDPVHAVLLFHGADADGARQSSAIVVRRALLDAGFVVLSLDHPGFGESSLPAPLTDIAAWDPMPTALAALEALRSMPGISKVYLLGHSMGSGDVLRVLGVERDVAGALLFGAGFLDPTEREEYWHRRFHADRRMTEYLPPGLLTQIRQYYDLKPLVDALPPDHAPVVFGRFARDWLNIEAGRGPLYDAIPGPKRDWTLSNSHHYFNSHKWGFMVLADTDVVQDLLGTFRRLNRSGTEAPGGRMPSGQARRQR